MNHSYTPPADPSALSLWPDVSAVGEEMIAWAQTAEYAQPGLEENNVLDATLAWGQSGMTFAEPLNFQNDFDFNWALGGTVAAGTSSHVPLSNATTMDALATVTIPEINNDTDNAYAGLLFPGSQDFSISRTPSLTTDGSIPSPQSDGVMNGLLGFHNAEAGPPSFVQPLGPPIPRDTGAFDPDQLTCVPPTWFMGGSDLAGVQPDFDPLGLLDDLLHPGLYDLIQPTSDLAPSTEAVRPMVTPEAGPSTPLGKRCRPSDDDESGGPEKRSRPAASRVPGGARSKKRTRCPSATRTQTMINNISKTAGYGAEMLGSTTAQGIYHRPMLGLRVPQGSVKALAQEQPSRIVGREVVEMRRDTGSSTPEQIVHPENAEDEGKLRKIPANLTERQRLMLQVTQADKDRGAVRVIKCKLCPETRILTWELFRRHCKTCEKHPLEVQFCPTCGDYFGRTDSRKRHNENQDQAVCLSTSQDDAREKMEMVERYLPAYNARLTDRLRNEREFKSSFSKVMTKKLVNTSKKVSRTEEIWSDDDSWADGL